MCVFFSYDSQKSGLGAGKAKLIKKGVDMSGLTWTGRFATTRKRPPTRRAKNLASAVRENIKSLQQKRFAEVTKVQTWK